MIIGLAWLLNSNQYNLATGGPHAACAKMSKKTIFPYISTQGLLDRNGQRAARLLTQSKAGQMSGRSRHGPNPPGSAL